MRQRIKLKKIYFFVLLSLYTSQGVHIACLFLSQTDLCIGMWLFVLVFMILRRSLLPSEFSVVFNILKELIFSALMKNLKEYFFILLYHYTYMICEMLMKINCELKKWRHK